MIFLKDLWMFLKKRKKFWVTPIIFVILVLLGLFVLAKDDRALYRFLFSETQNIQEIFFKNPMIS